MQNREHPEQQMAQQQQRKICNRSTARCARLLVFVSGSLVAENIHTSSFKSQDLKHSDKPVPLYLLVPPTDKDRYKSLMRLILNQIVHILTRDEVKPPSSKQDTKNKNHRLL